jgi:hypothetical protein
MMPWNTQPRLPVWTDTAMEQMTPAPCRGRLIVPSADLSALSECSLIRIILLITMIVPTAA